MSRVTKLLVLGAVAVGALVLAGVLVAGPVLVRQASGPAPDAAELERLDVYAQVPDFSLIERSWQPVRRADLVGKIWLLNFIYTECTETCPTQSLQLARLQSEFAGAPDLRLVSITVDPGHDTPEVEETRWRRHP